MLTLFGVAVLSLMMLMYALEARGRGFVLAFAIFCALSSAYGSSQVHGRSAWSRPSGPQSRSGASSAAQQLVDRTEKFVSRQVRGSFLGTGPGKVPASRACIASKTTAVDAAV